MLILISILQSPTKAVYNARHWNQPESETLPAPQVLKNPNVPVSRISSVCPHPQLDIIHFEQKETI